MIGKGLFYGVLFFVSITAGVGPAWASFFVQSQESTNIELKGYNGLAESILFNGDLGAGVKQDIETTYKGLALLVFSGGQQYPIILGSQPFLLKITNPNTLPSFTGSEENESFYSLLSGAEAGDVKYEFALLMIETKQLLDSTGSIRTVEELQAMKERFHRFVHRHYQELAHSDMLMRLIAQYFMMHEYVDYHILGTPAANIKLRYQEAITGGVSNWLDILKPNIPQHEILNYCVSLYYNRSMVTLASKIIENSREIAHCPGVEKNSITLPPSLALTDVEGNKKTLQELGGSKIVSFVSNDCPVSMVETVTKARLFAKQPDTTLIVIPLQPLSEDHMSMRRMIRGGNLLFIDDEKWIKENVPGKLKLPRFTKIEE